MLSNQYASVNNALNAYFFYGRFAMMPIYLDLEGDAKEWIAAKLDIEPKKIGDFVGRSVAETLRFDKADPYHQQLAWLQDWSLKGRKEPPPFTALLCAFSIAAERMCADENFSANNYTQRLFDLLEVSSLTHQGKLKQHAKATRQFWRALNIWLSENDYELGRPTAQQVNSWKYASYALSQALVRDGDRQRFSRLFEKMHLIPGEKVSEAEMLLYLHEWMCGEGPTTWMKKIWAVTDLRDRVVAAALDEFKAWSPGGRVTREGPGRARFQWKLEFSGFPRRRASLVLHAVGNASTEPLRLNSVSNIVVRRAFDGLDGELRLIEETEPGFRFLGPVSDIDINCLLLGSAVFVGELTGIQYTYTAKPIIVFSRSEDDPGYREVQRANLFYEHALMCHKSWIEKVEGHLAECARPGYTVLRPGGIPGIPEDWFILRGVEFIRAVNNAHESLYGLNPISGQASVAAVGGLKLGPSVWHADWPPRVEARSDREGSKLLLVLETLGLADKILRTAEAQGDFMETGFEPGDELEGANARAVVITTATELSEAGLSFRSANTPRPLGRQQLSHLLSKEGYLSFSAQKIARLTDDPVGLKGATILGELSEGGEPDDRDGILHVCEEIPVGEAEIESQVAWKTGGGRSSEAPESCVIRGYHSWEVEPFEKGDDRYEAKRMHCKTCGLQTLSRSRKVAKRNVWGMNGIDCGATRRKAPIETVPVIKSEVPGSPSIVLDGLCYLGSGGWHTFQRLAGLLHEEPWYPTQLASELLALGHIDTIEDRPGRISEWQVAPPALVVVGASSCYLAGFHSSDFIALIDRILTAGGGRYSPISNTGSLPVHRWDDVSDELLENLARDVRDPHGRAPMISRSTGAKIAANLAGLWSYLEDAPVIHLEAREAAFRFNPVRARWERSDGTASPGAYKVDLHGSRFFYRDLAGVARETGFAVAKALDARRNGVKLHSYDPVKGVLTSALGCEPPGLYARALVTASGRLPERADGRSIYRGVPPEVGLVIMKKLYEGEE
ncbi:hypothetical protein [Halomonas sp. LBP4]|uniref:hypothetical protein n=1 Tax=Halomonas sp. LBP4 TaxID=2044917 RepID=UPI0011B3FCE3|nr:hypothetical protein [Halomonas sp. LBP4]